MWIYVWLLETSCEMPRFYETQLWYRLLKTLFFHLLLAKKSYPFLPGIFITVWLEYYTSLFVILPLKVTQLSQQDMLTQCIWALFFEPTASLLPDKKQCLKFLCKSLHCVTFLAKFILRVDLWISIKCLLELILSHMAIHISAMIPWILLIKVWDLWKGPHLMVWIEVPILNSK